VALDSSNRDICRYQDILDSTRLQLVPHFTN
jgi:hypothetical protein